MGWVYLAIASVFEAIWPVCLKQSENFTRWPWGAIAIVVSIAGMGFLSLALKGDVPLGTGYAIWTGIGVLGTTTAGIWLFHESVSPLRLMFIGLILISVVGLRLSGLK